MTANTLEVYAEALAFERAREAEIRRLGWLPTIAPCRSEFDATVEQDAREEFARMMRRSKTP